MRKASTVALALAVTLLGSTLGQGVPAAPRTRAYTVVTLDGHRILATAKPQIRGLVAYVRLVQGGQLAVIKEELIDWKRTEAANATITTIAIPADATLVEQQAPVHPDRKALTALVLKKEFAKTSRLHYQTITRLEAARKRLMVLESAGTVSTGDANDRSSQIGRVKNEITNLNDLIDSLGAHLAQLRAEGSRLEVSLD